MSSCSISLVKSALYLPKTPNREQVVHYDKCFLFLSVTITLLEVYWALQIVETAYNNGLFSSEPIKQTSACQEQKKAHAIWTCDNPENCRIIFMRWDENVSKKWVSTCCIWFFLSFLVKDPTHSVVWWKVHWVVDTHAKCQVNLFTFV